MLKLSFLKVRPEKVARLREWMSELSRRHPEVLETFRREETRHEIVALLELPEPLLVYAIEAEDLARARAAFAESRLPLDIQHREVLQECIEGEWPSEVLLDLGAS